MKNVLRVLLVAMAVMALSSTSAWGLAYNNEEPPVVSPSDATPPVEVESGGTQTAPSGTLPVTGTDVVLLAGIGAGAILMGAVAVRGRRRFAPAA